jgi:hypothetical protein
MVDDRTFREWMDILGRHFKPLDPAVEKIYYDYLSSLMDSETFAEACRHVLISERFMPSAEAIAAKVLQTSEDFATQEWQQVLAACRSGDRPQISNVGREALRAAGGYSALSGAGTVQQFQMSQTFFAYYKQHAPAFMGARPEVSRQKLVASHPLDNPLPDEARTELAQLP